MGFAKYMEQNNDAKDFCNARNTCAQARQLVWCTRTICSLWNKNKSTKVGRRRRKRTQEKTLSNNRNTAKWKFNVNIRIWAPHSLSHTDPLYNRFIGFGYKICIYVNRQLYQTYVHRISNGITFSVQIFTVFWNRIYAKCETQTHLNNLHLSPVSYETHYTSHSASYTMQHCKFSIYFRYLHPNSVRWWYLDREYRSLHAYECWVWKIPDFGVFKTMCNLKCIFQNAHLVRGISANSKMFEILQKFPHKAFINVLMIVFFLSFEKV